MSRHRVRRGLRLPITGAPSDRIEDGPPPRRVALVAADYIGLRPTMHVAPGDTVARGQMCFEDKTTPGVRYTAPAAGTVVAVNRGDRRALQSVVIDVSRAEREGRGPETASFSAFSGRHPSGMTGDDVRALLVESGQWTALRARPFGRVADPAARPHSIFVTAMDTNPARAVRCRHRRGLRRPVRAWSGGACAADRRAGLRLHRAGSWAAHPGGRSDPPRGVCRRPPRRHGRLSHSHARRGRPEQGGVAPGRAGCNRDRPAVRDRCAGCRAHRRAGRSAGRGASAAAITDRRVDGRTGRRECRACGRSLPRVRQRVGRQRAARAACHLRVHPFRPDRHRRDPRLPRALPPAGVGACGGSRTGTPSAGSVPV